MFLTFSGKEPEDKVAQQRVYLTLLRRKIHFHFYVKISHKENQTDSSFDSGLRK